MSDTSPSASEVNANDFVALIVEIGPNSYVSEDDDEEVVCAQIQVVYSGVNVTSPSTCAQTTYS